MSWDIIDLHRRSCGLAKLPPFRRDDGHVDSRYWTPAAFRYRDAVRARIEAGHDVGKIDLLAFSRITKADEEGFRPTPAQTRQFMHAMTYRDIVTVQIDLYAREMRKRGIAYEAGDDEIPTERGVPTPDRVFKDWAMRRENWNVSDDAVDKRVSARRKAYEAVFGTH